MRLLFRLSASSRGERADELVQMALVRSTRGQARASCRCSSPLARRRRRVLHDPRRLTFPPPSQLSHRALPAAHQRTPHPLALRAQHAPRQRHISRAVLPLAASSDAPRVPQAARRLLAQGHPALAGASVPLTAIDGSVLSARAVLICELDEPHRPPRLPSPRWAPARPSSLS